MKKSKFKFIKDKHQKVKIADAKKQLAVKFLEKKIQGRKSNGVKLIDIETFIISNYKLKS